MVGVEQPEDHDKLADQLERESDGLEERSAELGHEISDVRDDWRRKRGDPGVPGAVPPSEDSDRDGPGDEVNPEDADRGEEPNTEASGDDTPDAANPSPHDEDSPRDR
jgi:hypothetical protein